MTLPLFLSSITTSLSHHMSNVHQWNGVTLTNVSSYCCDKLGSNYNLVLNVCHKISYTNIK